MPLKTTLTLAEMRNASKASILQNINVNNSKQDLVAHLAATDHVQDRATVTHDDQHRITRRVEVRRDVLTGDRTSGTVATYSYYPTGEIDTITVSQRDAANQETARRTIKHYTDGRQPTTTIQ